MECKSHTEAHLMSLAENRFRVIMEGIRNKIQPEISETQLGFVVKGTRNAMLGLSILTRVERCVQV